MNIEYLKVGRKLKGWGWSLDSMKNLEKNKVSLSIKTIKKIDEHEDYIMLYGYSNFPENAMNIPCIGIFKETIHIIL